LPQKPIIARGIPNRIAVKSKLFFSTNGMHCTALVDVEYIFYVNGSFGMAVFGRIWRNVACNKLI